MFRNFLIVSYRNLMKGKLFIFVNVVGLAIALSCCIVGYFAYDFNRNFDSNYENTSTIYRVSSWRESENQKTKYGHVPVALGSAVAQNIGDIEKIIRISDGDGNFRVGLNLFRSDLRYVDTTFFQAFTFSFIEGNGSLADRTGVVISESLSRKFFGDEPALGKSIDHVLEGSRLRTFTVTGVFRDPPLNSSFAGDIYSNFYNQDFYGDWDENSWNYRTGLFISIPDPSRRPMVTSGLQQYTQNNNKATGDFIISEFEVEPFWRLRELNEKIWIRESFTRDGFPPELIIAIGVTGAVILLITCFNMINTFIAISARRLKEIGIRKVMGSTRKNLIIQFMGETLMICVAALALGLFVAHFFMVPSFNSLWPEMKVEPVYLERPGFLIFLILIVLLTALLAGGYPALYISKFRPIEILKGKLRFSRNNAVTYALLTFQFALSLLGLICSVAFIDNSKFQDRFDFGFDKSGLVFTEVANRIEFESFRNVLIQNADIISISGSPHHVSGRKHNNTIKSGSTEIDAQMLYTGDDYVATAGLELTAGRDFVNGSETDIRESAIVTEETVRRFGWTNPLGMKLTLHDTISMIVIGVVKNIYNKGFFGGLDPMVIRKGDKEIVNYIIVSTKRGKVEDVNRFMASKWRELFPDRLYDGVTMDYGLWESARVNGNFVRMSSFMGIVALLLSIIGLFTLVSLNINARMKEVGVRKVLGAGLGNLSWVLNKEFMVVLLLGCVGGTLLGNFTAEYVIQGNWRTYQPVTSITLISSVLLLLLAAALSTAQKIYSIARLNPADILRDE